MVEDVYIISGNFENPGDQEVYSIFARPGDASYDSSGNQIDLGEIEGMWEITQNGGPIATKTGDSPIGQYTNYFSVVLACIVSDPPVNASNAPRRSSLQLSRDDQDALDAIAFRVGATYRGKGSYRTLLRRILSGHLRVEQVNNNLLFGKVKGL